MQVVRKGDWNPRRFKGVDFTVGATGDQTMVTLMTFAKGQTVGEHMHPHEQCGYCLKGRFELTVEGRTELIGPGDSYVIPGRASHSYVVLEDAEAVEVFSPPREDYL